jgi:hypothetical protein
MAYPTDTLQSRMILLASPIASLLQVKWDGSKVDFASSDGAGTLQTGFARFLFDNLASQPKITIKVQGASASTGENTDFNRADGAIIRFPKNSLIISGKDESLITETANDEYASGLGDLSLVTNEADLDSISFTAMLQKLVANKESLFLAVVPTGFTYKSRYVDAAKTVDGYIYQLYRITTDIDFSATTLTIGLSATKASYLKKEDGTSITVEELEEGLKLFNAEFTGANESTYVGVKLKGEGSKIVPKAFTIDDTTDKTGAHAQSLYDGDMVIISKN